MAKGNTGKRYSDADKKKILAFIETEGRGGITKAKAKWGVSYIAVKRWMKPQKVFAKRGRPAATSKATPAKVRRLEKLVNRLFVQVGKVHKAIRALSA